MILASASSTRARILEDAGVACACEAAAIDEAAIKAARRRAGATVEQVAAELAAAKAKAVSERHGEALVIGADQILDCAGTWFDKPADEAQAARHLRALGGRTHRLVSAVCVVREGRNLWHHVASPTLTMRPLAAHDIAAYLRLCGPEILETVGAYRLEGPGAQLFSAVDGDYFTILGLPLLPLLAFLRTQGSSFC